MSERKCPHCNGSLDRYEDPAAVKIIGELTKSCDQLRAELAEANNQREQEMLRLKLVEHILDGDGAAGAQLCPTAQSAVKVMEELVLARKCVEALRYISAQKPEKPDHYTPCGQCDRNIDEAKEAVSAYDDFKRKETP